MPGATDNLRFALRRETAMAHDMLDSAMQEAAGWRTKADYARFLTLQYTARHPVEAWLGTHAASDSLPPPQTPRIAEDLVALGVAKPSFVPVFALASAPTDGARASAALGVAWALAGSSLGNRSILAEIRRGSSDQTGWPHAFLGDEAMLSFWKALRRRIERPANGQEMVAASCAASAVFDHFLRVAVLAEGPADEPRKLSAAAS